VWPSPQPGGGGPGGPIAVADVPDLPASKITSGTVAPTLLGSGSPSASTFLRGDQTWAQAGVWEFIGEVSGAAISWEFTGLSNFEMLRFTLRNAIRFANSVAVQADISVTFNGDTGANYGWRTWDTVAATGAAQSSYRIPQIATSGSGGSAPTPFLMVTSGVIHVNNVFATRAKVMNAHLAASVENGSGVPQAPYQVMSAGSWHNFANHINTATFTIAGASSGATNHASSMIVEGIRRPT